MMKKVSFRKYTVFLLVCFFSLVFNVKAADDDLTINVKLPYGSVYTISSTGYEGFTCDTSGLSALSATHDSTNGYYSVKLKEVMNNEGTENIVCTYTSKVSVQAPGSTNGGKKTFKITYTAGVEETYEYYLGFGIEFIDVAAQLGATEIVNYRVQAKGQEYIDMGQCNKGSASCKVYLSSVVATLPADQNYISIVEFTYKANGSSSNKVATVHFNINAFQGAWIWDNWTDSNPLGFCNYNSDWEQASSSRTNTHTVYYYRSIGTNAVLPNCTVNPSNVVPVEFKGWVAGVEGDTGISSNASVGHANSSYLYAVGKCPATIDPGTKVTAHTNYAPCYEMNNAFVRLSLSTGSVDSSDWTRSNASMYEYLHFGDSTADTVVLPEVVYSGKFADKKELQCWENTSTGECVAPGTSVPTDGTVYAAITDTEHEDYSYYKSVSVNKSVVFDVDGMTSCNLAAGEPTEYLAVADMNGECLVTGLKVTGGLDPDYVRVEVNLENGSKKIYNFNVEEDVGLSSGGNGTFFVDPAVNSGEENAYTDSNGFQTSSCTSFDVSPGDPKTIGGGLRSNTYNVSPNCADGGTYVAMCLDPGREGPDGAPVEYQRVNDIEGSSDLGRFIAYLVEKKGVDFSQFKNKDSVERVAAHISIRIIAIQTNFATGADLAYDSLFVPYQKTVNAIASQNPTDASDYAKIIKNNMGIDKKYADLAGEYLAEYKEATNAEEEHGFERTIETSDAIGYGNGYVITYTGTITAPSYANNVKLVAPPSSNGLSFEVVSWEEEGKTSTNRTIYRYELTITADNTILVIPPKSQAEKILLSFRIEFDGGQTVSNAFLAQPVNNAASLQRMIIFDVESTDLYIYFNIAPNNCEIKGLDYKVCLSEDNCPEDQFNGALFKASGCCRYVADEVTYAYVVNSVCAAKCTTSTMTNVCNYHTTGNLAEIYEIKEGSKYSSSDGYTNAIGSCIADVDKQFVNSTSHGEHEFENFDDNGNSLMVDYYQADNNQYCRINCKEDWQLSMDGFGNYIGEKAVAAGSYFQIENDVFIGGKRTCYSNYIDYHKYMNEIATLSAGIVAAYNEYSKESHSYSDILDMQGIGDNTISSDGGVSWYKREKKCYKSCWMEKVGSGSTATEVKKCGDVTCSTSDIEKKGTYYQFTYKDVQHEFSGGDAGTGQYKTYSGSLTTPADNFSHTEHKNINDADGAYSTDHSRSITCSRTMCEISATCEPGSEVGSNSCTVGTCTETGASNMTCTDNQKIDTNNKDLAFPYLEEKLLKDIETELNGLRGTIAGNASRIRQKIDDMWECQHFQLVNTTDANNGEFADTVLLSGQYHKAGTKPYIQVSTAFDPSVSYEYAEDAFMSIILRNKENYLVMYDEKNNAYYQSAYGKDYKDATNASLPAKVKLSETSTVNVNLSRNKHQITYYNIGNKGGMWSANTDPWRNYGGDDVAHDTVDYGIMSGSGVTHGKYRNKTIILCGITGNGGGTYVTSINFKGIEVSSLVGGSPTPEWKGGACFETQVPYLEANYIAASLENSSFYKNQGTWYSNIHDVKAHGEDLRAALENENNHVGAGYVVDEELTSERWTPIGLMNVFPISLTTPRNMYTYTYTFRDIGSHAGGELGRVMGSDTAIISNNNRTCFYEVFEELCLCCGDKINTYVYNDPDENDLIRQVMASSGYGESNQDLIEENDGGTLAFATSSVNLSDIDLDASGRPTATNWSDASPFTYGGEYNLTTSKGDQLKKTIESKGETIYASSATKGAAEYSYYLTPTTLSKIREYNDKTGYEMNYNNLKVYGRYTIAPMESCSDVGNNSCWTSSDVEKLNDYINFQHYGSVFLEELAKDTSITSASTLARAENKNVCLVVDGKFDANTISDLVKNKKCRWIDYVENISDNTEGAQKYVYPYYEDIPSSKKADVTYFRLAFK